MPRGKGTYGKKRGRPSKRMKKTTVYSPAKRKKKGKRK